MTNRNDIEKLFRTHYEMLHRLARILLHDSDLAHDIVHDVFASLINSGDDCSGITGAYLLSSVRNRCLNHIRNAGARERIHSLYLLEQSEYDTDDWPDEETVATVDRIMDDCLTDRCRLVVDMRFTGGLSYAAIASALGISEVAVYKHLRHAIETIRKNLRENG